MEKNKKYAIVTIGDSMNYDLNNNNQNNDEISTGFNNPVPNNNPVNTGFNNPVPNNNPVNTGFNNPVPNNNLVNTGFNNPVPNNNPVNTGFNNPVSNNNIVNTGFNNPVSNNNIVNTGFSNLVPNNNIVNAGFNNPIPNNNMNNTNGKNKKVNIGIIIGAIAAIILAIVYLPILFASKPIGTWNCESSTYKDITFNSKDMTMTIDVGGYTGTMTAKYSKSFSLNSPKVKKDGYKYVIYKLSDVSVSASGYSSNLNSMENHGFFLGTSKDGKTIHYVAGEDENSVNFICTKR